MPKKGEMIMKRIVCVLLCAAILCGCGAVSDPGRNKNERINEEFLAGYKNEESYHSLPVAVSSETADIADGSGYVINYYGTNNNIVKTETYRNDFDKPFCVSLFYTGQNREKTVTEYNPEYYEHQEKLYPSPFPRVDLLKKIDYYGEATASLKNPAMQSGPIIFEYFYSDGSWSFSRYLLDEWNEQYLELSESYDGQGNLITTSRGKPGQGWDAVTLEYYDYDNGQMIRKVECDLVERTAICTEYKNGEPVSTATWKIDENGMRID